MIDILRACSDRKDVALLLGVKPSELSYILYFLPDAKKYTAFCVSKKNGKTRNILAPSPRLKYLQKQLLSILYECEDDHLDSEKKSPNLSFGFRRKMSSYDNAYRHRGRSFVLNLDIADYFDQFNFGRVRGLFLKDKRFLLNDKVATTLAQIACFDNKLPQGSPCSPHIANLASNFFDQRMVRFLRPLRCRYSRYADDITISTDTKAFPERVAKVDASTPQGWSISDELIDIFLRSGFMINFSKLRMSRYFSRQTVTGLVVNDRPNIAREYYLTARAMCHRLFKGEPIELCVPFAGLTNSCNPGEPIAVIDPVKHLEGRLAHIDHIREFPDTRPLREKQDEPTQFFTTLLKFYLFKFFVGNQAPTILTEGPSDIIYLKTAMKGAVTNFAELKHGTTILPKFFKFNGRPAEVLALTGGCGTLKRFVYLYNLHSKHFVISGERQPVIIVVDNDKAGGDVVKMINGIWKTTISMTDPKLWSRVTKDFYVVRTPLQVGKPSSCIEDALPPSVRNVILNGKTFSPLPKFDTSKHFGKVPLASYVQANVASISFVGFDPILEAINNAIIDSRT